MQACITNKKGAEAISAGILLKAGQGEMFYLAKINNFKAEEAMSLFRPLRTEFQDCALKQIKKPTELQNK